MKHLEKPREIFPLLLQVREEMQNLAHRHDTIGKDTLAGWCILTSYVLFHILKRRGYQPEICKNDAHAFIVLDGWYIDVTATQFNSPWNKEKGVLYPAIYCKKRPAKNSVHAINGRTSNADDIWTSFCQGWSQPVPLSNPVIENMVTEY
jgi:hypothetical protein